MLSTEIIRSLTPEEQEVKACEDGGIRGVVGAQDLVVGPQWDVGAATLDSECALATVPLCSRGKEADFLIITIGILAGVEHPDGAITVVIVAGPLAGVLLALEPVGTRVLCVPVPQKGGHVEVLGDNSIDI